MARTGGLIEGDSLVASLMGGLRDSMGSLVDQITGLREEHDKDRRERVRINQALYTIPDIVIGQITAASGAGSILKQPELAGPKTGQVWFVTRIGFQGLTAGQV